MVGERPFKAKDNHGTMASMYELGRCQPKACCISQALISRMAGKGELLMIHPHSSVSVSCSEASFELFRNKLLRAFRSQLMPIGSRMTTPSAILKEGKRSPAAARGRWEDSQWPRVLLPCAASCGCLVRHDLLRSPHESTVSSDGQGQGDEILVRHHQPT